MKIVGFKETSLTEWEGHISSIIWTAGCNWRCIYCHAKHLIEDVDNLPPIKEEQIFKTIESKNGWIDGICVSGGEPTIHNDLPKFLERIKNRLSLPIKLETNGSNPSMIQSLINNKLIDCLSIDFKQIIGTKLMFVNNQKGSLYDILYSMDIAFSNANNLEIEFHTTLCPSCIDIDDIIVMGKFLHNIGRWVLQQYDPNNVLMPELAGNRVYDKGKIIEIYEKAKILHTNTILKNINE